MKPIVIIGAGKIAYAIAQYVRDWQLFEIAAFVVDREYLTEAMLLECPVIDLAELGERYPASDYDAFVAIGYQGLNRLRREKVDQLQQIGYRLVSVVHPQALSDLRHGDNCFVAEAEGVQPGVSCGENVFVWSGALIGHHARLEDDCWITGGAMLGGSVQVGQGSFVGLGAKVAQEIVIGARSLVGAGALLVKDVAEGSVLIEKPTQLYRLSSHQFLRFSSDF